MKNNSEISQQKLKVKVHPHKKILLETNNPTKYHTSQNVLIYKDIKYNNQYQLPHYMTPKKTIIQRNPNQKSNYPSTSTNINITRYIVEGNVALSKNIAVTVTEKPIPIEPPTTDDTGEFGTISKTDAYLAFHHQREGVMTYIKSKSKNIPADRLEQEVDIDRTANKIYIIPEATADDIRLNKSEVFHLALREDVTNATTATGSINPNYLDYKEIYNPISGFTGNNTREVNYWLNIKTGERIDFVSQAEAKKHGFINIQKNLKGQTSHCGGYKWYYLKGDDVNGN